MQLLFIENSQPLILLQYNYPWYERFFDIIVEFGIVIVPLLLLFFILRKKQKTYHSHRKTLIEGFEYSTEEFYRLLRNELSIHGIDNIDSSHTNLATGGLGSHRRMYLEINWKGLSYYVCAPPFGDNYFVSSWLQNTHSSFEVLIYMLPFIGGRLHNVFYTMTIYKTDTASMFMTFAHKSLMKVIDQVTLEAGVRALTEDERKPQLADFFKR